MDYAWVKKQIIHLFYNHKLSVKHYNFKMFFFIRQGTLPLSIAHLENNFVLGTFF